MPQQHQTLRIPSIILLTTLLLTIIALTYGINPNVSDPSFSIQATPVTTKSSDRFQHNLSPTRGYLTATGLVQCGSGSGDDASSCSLDSFSLITQLKKRNDQIESGLEGMGPSTSQNDADSDSKINKNGLARSQTDPPPTPSPPFISSFTLVITDTTTGANIHSNALWSYEVQFKPKPGTIFSKEEQSSKNSKTFDIFSKNTPNSPFVEEKLNFPSDLINIVIPKFTGQVSLTGYVISLVITIDHISQLPNYDMSSTLSFVTKSLTQIEKTDKKDEKLVKLIQQPYQSTDSSTQITAPSKTESIIIQKFPYISDQSFHINNWFAVSSGISDRNFRFWTGIQGQSDGILPNGGFWDKNFDISKSPFDEYSKDGKANDYVKQGGYVQVDFNLYTTHPTGIVDQQALLNLPKSETIWSFSPLPLQNQEVQFFPPHLDLTNCYLGHIPIVMSITRGGVSLQGNILVSTQDLDTVQNAQLTCLEVVLRSPELKSTPNKDEIIQSHSDLLGHLTMKVWDNEFKSKLIKTYQNMTLFDTYAGFFPQFVSATKVRRDIKIQYPPPLHGYDDINEEQWELENDQVEMLQHSNNKNDSKNSHHGIQNSERKYNNPDSWTSSGNLYAYDIIYPVNDIQSFPTLQAQIQQHRWRSPVFYTHNKLCPIDSYPLYCKFPQDFTSNILKYIAICPIQGDHVRTLPATIIDNNIGIDQRVSDILDLPYQVTIPWEEFFQSQSYLYTPYFRLLFSDYRWLDHYFEYELDPVTTIWLQAPLWKFKKQATVKDQFAFQSTFAVGNSKYYNTQKNLPHIRLNTANRINSLDLKPFQDKERTGNNDIFPHKLLGLESVGVKKVKEMMSTNFPFNNNAKTYEFAQTNGLNANIYQFNFEFNPDIYQPTTMANSDDENFPSEVSDSMKNDRSPDPIHYSRIRLSFMFNEGSFLGDFNSCHSSTHHRSDYTIHTTRSYSTPPDENKFSTVMVTFSSSITSIFSILCENAFVSIPISSGIHQVENKYKLEMILIGTNAFHSDYVSNYISQILGSPLRSNNFVSITDSSDGYPVPLYPTNPLGPMSPETKSFMLTHPWVRTFAILSAGCSLLLFLSTIAFILCIYDSEKGKLKPNFVIKVHDDIHSTRIGNKPNMNRERAIVQGRKTGLDNIKKTFDDNQGRDRSGLITKQPTFIDLHFIPPHQRQRVLNQLIGGGKRVVVDSEIVQAMAESDAAIEQVSDSVNSDPVPEQNVKDDNANNITDLFLAQNDNHSHRSSHDIVHGHNTIGNITNHNEGKGNDNDDDLLDLALDTLASPLPTSK